MKFLPIVLLLGLAFFSSNAQVQRIPMHEHFCSSTCSPCHPASINMSNIYNANSGRQVYVNYQMSWPGSGDPYFFSEANDRRIYYGINSIPQLEIDGQWHGNTNSLTAAIRDSYYAIPAHMKIYMDYEIDSNVISVFVSVVALDSFPGDNRLHVVVFEKTTHNNFASNGQIEFKNIVKKMMPDAQGTSLGSLAAGDSIFNFLTYTFPGSYRLPPNSNNPIDISIEHSVEQFYDLGIAAFVQEHNTKQGHQATYGSDLIQLDGAIVGSSTPTINANLGPIMLEGIFQNWKSTIVNDLEVAYSVNNGSPQFTQFSNLSLGIGDSLVFQHTNPWNPNSPGTYTIKSWANKINGMADEANKNDTLIQQITIINLSPPVVNFSAQGLSPLSVHFLNHTQSDTNFAVSYSWDFGDGSPFNSMVEPAHTYSSLGTYDVCLTATNQAGSSTNCNQITLPVTGIGKDLLESVKVFPNPTEGKIFVENPFSLEMEVIILNPKGQKLILKKIPSKGLEEIDLSNFKAGTYFLSLKNFNGESVRKVTLK